MRTVFGFRLLSGVAIIAFLAVSILLFASSAKAQDEPASSLKHSLGSIFDPQRAPAQKSMGLLQRSFLDLVETSRSQLQVALVIDGTDSMAFTSDELTNSFRDLAGDLIRYRGQGNVSFAIVVYRDSGSESGVIQTPLPRFTSDLKVVEEVVAKIRSESGAPFFPELVDQGVHHALQELPWSDDESVTRWLLLLGDAPPFRENFVDRDTGSQRKFANDVLINLARQRQIQISCVLCESRNEEETVHQEVLDETREFMSELSSKTDGLMLDLSFADVRQALAEAARPPSAQTVSVGKIEKSEIEQIRLQARTQELPVSQSQRIRIAVLPHLPLEQMSFQSRNPAVQVSAELRELLQQLPRVQTTNPILIDRELRRVVNDEIPKDQWLRALAVRLRVDYLIWGSFQRTDALSRLQSAIYASSSGKIIVTADQVARDAISESELTFTVAENLLGQAISAESGSELAGLAVALRGIQSDQNVFIPVVFREDSQASIWTAYEALDQATEFPQGSAEADRLLAEAESMLQDIMDGDPRNPFAHQLLASCYFNLAASQLKHGNQEIADQYRDKYLEALKRAYRSRLQVEWPILQKEIEADYLLMVRQEYQEAIRRYEELSDDTAENPLGVSQRAHWMLAGIYGGDWGVPESIVDREKARKNLVAILAHWPDSSQAEFIRTAIRWNQEKGENEYEHFPRENELVLSGQQDSSNQ